MEKRNSCTAGYKSLWHKQDGYPSNDFFKALDPRLENVVRDKLNHEIYPLGTNAGELTEEMAQLIQLLPGTTVAVGNVDAHVAVPALGVTTPGKMVMVLGTSEGKRGLNEKKLLYKISKIHEECLPH